MTVATAAALRTPAVTVACSGCGTPAPDGEAFPTSCPAAVPGDDIDHCLVRRIDPTGVRLAADDDPNPFVRYRQLFRAWHLARAAGSRCSSRTRKAVCARSHRVGCRSTRLYTR